MNKRIHNLIPILAAAAATALVCPRANADLIDLTTDGSGNFNITAVPFDVTLNQFNAANKNNTGPAQTVHAWILRDSSAGAPAPAPGSGIPVLRMRLTAGQRVTVNFKNMLPAGANPEGASIHWHGIELDNDSDGVAVTQDSVLSGQCYTYRFIAPRPGLFWFHSHMLPGNTLFAGMYGIIIVTDCCESGLVSSNRLPAANSTFQLALSDIQWDDRAQTNSVNNPNFGNVGKYNSASITGTVGHATVIYPPGTFQTINKWIHDCGDNESGVGTSQPGGGALCKFASGPGNSVLVNGLTPEGNAAPLAPGGTPAPLTFPVVPGQSIRLQLFNEALTRSFDLFLVNPTNNQTIPLYRIGGQGGLLDKARLEGDDAGNPNGGNDFGWVSAYAAGHISISSGVRSDAATCIPGNVAPNTTLILMASNNVTQWPLQNQGYIRNLFPIAYFKVGAGAAPAGACVTNGYPIRMLGGCHAVENITNGAAINQFIPTNQTPAHPSSANSTISLTSDKSAPSIDNLNLSPANYPAGNQLDVNYGNGTAWQVAPLATDRYAHVGDVLLLTVANGTGNMGSLAHPYHLHGFSMQPIAMVDDNGTHEFGYNEFLDTIDVYSGQSYIFSVRLDDRPKLCDLSCGSGPNNGPVLQPCTDGGCGGALGRWLYHCHIASHGVLGMMGEIIVLASGQQPMGLGQPPDTITPGVDVLATAGTGSQTVADDFLWQNPGPITHVTVWGSWLADQVDPGATFELKFWTDVPACNPMPSRPGWQAWEQMFPPGTYTFSSFYQLPPGAEKFVDPSQGSCIPPGDSIIWKYDFNLPTDSTGFYPLPGSPINWISVTAYTATNSGLRFGWKTTPLQYGWNDDSSWSSTLWGPPWSELIFPACIQNPNIGASMNQAFQLYIPGTSNCVNMPILTNCAPAGGPVVSAQPPFLTATPTGAQVTITWAGGGTLQSAPTPLGPWSVVPDSSGTPYVTSPNADKRFYRVVLP
ncbi:MAG: hypothetical protein C5B50_04525 [Verrucomicrobia bacterium]|nr:MAG: hypothetical protein C5B50_04525 [Verrucomicrobiota bacterium]